MKLRERFANYLHTERIENFVLFSIAFAALVTTAGFWFGIPCSKWTIWIGLIISLAFMSICNYKHALMACALIAVCFVLTAWTFPYVGVDYQVCHAPMQRALMHGWNPVLQGTVEELDKFTNGGCWAGHALFIPHLTHLVGALVALSSGLFLAESFFSYVLLYALCASAYRFANNEWQLSRAACVLFALSIAFPFGIFLIFIGSLDYPFYASLAFAIFAILNYEKNGLRDDLFAAVLGMSFAVGIKPLGIVFGLVGLIYLLSRHIKIREVRYAIVVGVIFTLVVNAAPTLVAWIRYGSPFYPVHSFNPAIPLQNLTSDFTCNADGEQMGYLSRIVYAWFSKGLAIWSCSVWYGKPDFNPWFGVPGGVAGLKELFKCMMWCAVIALALAKKNRVTITCLVVFVLSNVAPLKYIGYGRYFPLMWLITPLAAYNLLANPPVWLRPVMKAARIATYGLFTILFLSILAKGTAHFIRQNAIEGERQIAFEKIVTTGNKPGPDDWRRRYITNERYRQLKPATSSLSAMKFAVGKFDDIVLVPWTADSESRALNEEYPICYKLSDYARFKWRNAFSVWPHPIWDYID